MASGYELGLSAARCNCWCAAELEASVVRGVCETGGVGVGVRRSCGCECARAAGGAALVVGAAASVIRGEVVGSGLGEAALRWAGAAACGTSVVRGAVMGLGVSGLLAAWQVRVCSGASSGADGGRRKALL